MLFLKRLMNIKIFITNVISTHIHTYTHIEINVFIIYKNK